MPDFSHITACNDVSEEEIERALAPARSFDEASPRERLIALAARMAEVATPGAGAPRLLSLAARAAARDWLEGKLFVRLIGDHEVSVLELLVDDGLSRQRILGPLRVDVPLDEFGDALEAEPALFEPLIPIEWTDRRMLLESSAMPVSRAPKVSAFASGLMRAVAGRTAGAPEQPSDKPARAEPAKPPPRRSRSIASFEKPAPTLVFDTEDDAEKSKRR